MVKMETIGSRLKRLRSQYNFTQEDIAKYLDYNQGQIARIENDTRKLKDPALKKLCDLYNCSENYILHGQDEYKKNNYVFRSNIHNKDLNGLAKMNRILRDIEYLNDITQKL